MAGINLKKYGALAQNFSVSLGINPIGVDTSLARHK